MNNTNYIDLDHDNNPIQFHQAMAEHPELKGVIAKASQGIQEVDPAFADYRQRAKECGLTISAYHYLTPEVGAEAQFVHFTTVVGSRTDIDMIAVDVEQNDRWSNWNDDNGNPNSGLIISKTANWLNVALATGHKTALYMDNDFYQRYWEGIANQISAPDSVIRWVARYGAEPSVDYDLWQWSDTETIGGSAGVDASQVNPNGRLA